MRDSGRWGAALALALWCIACGGDEELLSRASGTSMSPSRQRRPAVEETATRNRAPRIDTVRFEPGRTQATDETVRAIVEAEDPDGDPLSYRFTWTVRGRLYAERGPRLALFGVRRGDPIEVTVTASDGHAESESVSATTRIANAPPLITGARFEPSNGITAGGEVTVHPEAKDSDDDPLSFSHTWWVNRSPVAEAGPTLSTVGLKRGDRVRVRIIATDGQDESDGFESPEITLENAGPTIVSEPAGADPNGIFRYKIQAVDPEGDRPLHYSLTEAPEGMTVTPIRGEIEWRPKPDQAGTHSIELVVEDSKGARTVQRFQVIVGG